MRILILNGPNLNRLGKRQPEVYGTTTMEQVMTDLQRRHPDVCFTYLQSNYEGFLIDTLQTLIAERDAYVQGDSEDEPVAGVVMNPGGLCHTSISLRDAVEDAVTSGIPVVEVHISDISKRESFRRKSLLTEVCTHAVIGQGINGYAEAIEWLQQTTNG